MACKHTITSRDGWFLDKHMKDPVAQEPFKVGDTIVICAKCRTAHYESSWDMNANRCCSMGCNCSEQLNFNTFSPVIFQPKSSRNAKFKVIVEKLTFRERLKLFNGYPIAYMITVLIPILTFILVFYTAEDKAVPVSVSSVIGLLEESQDKLVGVMANSLPKFEKMMGSIDTDMGEMEYKFINVLSSFNETDLDSKITEINDNLESTEIIDKLDNNWNNIHELANCAWKKVRKLFYTVTKFTNKVFE